MVEAIKATVNAGQIHLENRKQFYRPETGEKTHMVQSTQKKTTLCDSFSEEFFCLLIRAGQSPLLLICEIAASVDNTFFFFISLQKQVIYSHQLFSDSSLDPTRNKIAN